MTKPLATTLRTPNSARSKHRPKGWTPERRARQAARIRNWQPWRRSTGPQTEAGKARAAQNALKHGNRSRAHIFQLQRVRHAIRLCAYTVAAVRAHMRGFPLPCLPKPEGRKGTPAPLRREAEQPRDIRPAIMRPSERVCYCPPPQKAARIGGFVGARRQPWQ
jgi:hypothetical protein